MKTPALAPRLVLVVAFVFAGAACARAASYTWPKNRGSGSWADAANWTPEGVPAAGDSATVEAGRPARFEITLEGANRDLKELLMQGSGDSGIENMLVIDLAKGASLTTSFTVKQGGQILVKGGTLSGVGENSIGASQTGGKVTVDGGALLIGGGGMLAVRNGKNADSVLEVRAGSFAFHEDVHGYVFVVGETVGPGPHTGMGVMNVEGGTATVNGSASEMRVGNWGTNGVGTAVLNLTGGTLNIFPGSEKQRMVVGGRAPGYGKCPDSAFAEDLAQLNVSGGTLNADGHGIFLGRNGESPGEFTVSGGEANLGGMVLGSMGKLTQSKGVLTFTGRRPWLNEATGGVRRLFMSGGLVRFQGVHADQMTVDMGGPAAGNTLGQGFWNVEFGGEGMGPVTIALPNEFHGCGTAQGGNGIPRDGIKDLKVWSNVTVEHKGATYHGTAGANSLQAFAKLAQSWGWDAFVESQRPGRLPQRGR
jgi:hypothetical protein